MPTIITEAGPGPLFWELLPSPEWIIILQPSHQATADDKVCVYVCAHACDFVVCWGRGDGCDLSAESHRALNRITR